MAESESTRGAGDSIHPVVERMFTARFPGARLISFEQYRAAGPKDRHLHNIEFVGDVDALLKARLVEPFMLPCWPKRTRRSADAESYNPLIGNWRSTWRSKRVLRVWRQLSDDTPPDHVLAEFGVRQWPVGETAGQRQARFTHEVENAAGKVRAIEQALRDVAQDFGVAAEQFNPVFQMLDFVEALAFDLSKPPRAIRSSRHLRLVVDNSNK